MNGSDYVVQWLFAFLLTQSIEIGVYVNLLRPTRPRRERFAIAFGASAITHPMVWFVIPARMAALRMALEIDMAHDDWWWVTVAVAEAFAFSAEAIWMAAFGMSAGRAARASALANGASFLVGLVVYQLFGW